ncbi:GNAT family N-acetyltransferase [Fusibacter sp. JL216-2]|uniref:GNAT family N-acetyltransferase n=1 Tax=Fusibacter sp. JL216-2 TaxID=3071453 RepID=UPI003D32879F
MVTIRQACESDFESINRLYEQLDKLHRVRHAERFQEPAEIGRTKEYLINLLENSMCHLAVATDDEKVIGFVEGRLMESPDFDVLVKRKYIQINSLVVDTSRRSEGTGQLLLDHLIKWGQDHGAKSAELNVYIFNESAISLYENNGFKVITQSMYKKI